MYRYQKRNEDNDALEGIDKIANTLINAHKIGGTTLVFIIIGVVFFLINFLFRAIYGGIIFWVVFIFSAALIVFPPAYKILIRKKDIKCPTKCGGILAIKNGKYGKFLGCSNYPKCRYSKSIE